jgi:RNA polymerase sigma factor (sigma-70 family)
VLNPTPPPSPETPGASPPLRLVASRPGFEDVYKTEYLRMVRTAAMLLGCSEGAEDVVQDAFVALYHHYDSVTDPPGYLYRSVVNGCGSRFRHRKVVARFRHLTTVTDTTDHTVDITWSALRSLAPRRRAVIVLRFYADLPLAEIAQILDSNLGTVKSMLHRALGDLREVIEP